ncbi:unknown [Megasphaera elsdenii CAG:570]|uniref:Uncharacterized protein n=1 Tax=Megasphaera elsdenii CAG:570 TaxID=1263087 RepID=R7N0C7_MEGEL|nr:unknown [Megasphaera elsdenii CAG:570]
MSRFPGTSSSSLRACPVRASRPWLLIRFTPKASVAMSNLCRPMPGSSWARWISPMSITLKACRRLFPSTRRRRAAIPGRPSGRLRKSTITCACSMPASAKRIARNAASPSASRLSSRWPMPSWPSAKAKRSWSWPLSSTAARGPIRNSWPNWSRTATSASASTAKSTFCPMISPWIRTRSIPSTSSSTAWSSRTVS